ncbi:MAG: sugar phosphate nucleotidyltransferase, partial [Nocardiaceae bacterium]|nr:sugar phosphate nucleotidyltransferase [Nocardiaceae bacterium]
MRSQPHVLGIVLAGGEGKRLYPLTADRAKPAVPFGGAYRLIDFVLSNLVNAGYLRICVLTQYKSHSLDRHISQTWRLSGFAGEYITPVPAQQRLGPRWYTGSADAIFQSLNLVYDEDPEYIVVFGADHVYRMDPEQMVQHHIDSGAGVTVAGIRVPRSEAYAFGCIDSDESGPILTPDQHRLLDALADQAALAIERVNLVEDVDRARLVAETDRLRAALLTSISHDLRTPLASILGSATSLR